MKMIGVYSNSCGSCGRNEKCYAPSKVSDWLSETKVFRFERVWLLTMYRGKLSAALFPCCSVFVKEKTDRKKDIAWELSISKERLCKFGVLK